MSDSEDLNSDPIYYTSRAPQPPSNFRIEAAKDWSSAKVVLYEGTDSEAWQAWWSTTPWYLQHPGKKIEWSTRKKIADTWQYFRTCARSTDGKPFVQCTRCTVTLAHPGIGNTGTSALSRHIKTQACSKHSAKKGLSTIIAFLQDKDELQRAKYITDVGPFTHESFMAQTLRVLSSLNLSFRSLDHIELRRWIELIRRAPKTTDVRLIPSRKIRNYLTENIRLARDDILRLVPIDAKISIALDCWTSPNHHSFLAITGYFIDNAWNYQEVLLGFEHVLGSHTGQRLAEIVQNTLQDCEINTRRVLTMTTDNASNNKTLAQALDNVITILNEDSPHQGITRLPCLAHVIQLACRELLIGIKIQARNDRVINVWHKDASSREQHTTITSSGGAPSTLKKLRDTVIFINASTQRRDKFHAVQSRRRPLNLVQDVATRWNSTLKMMLRARRLRDDIERYVYSYPDDDLETISETEWQHIDYLIEILYPFHRYTNAVGQVRNGPTIHNVYAIYDKLFNHIETYVMILSRKRLTWKKQIHTAVLRSQEKLRSYYIQTTETLGEIYAVATILGPRWKLSLFEGEEWINNERDWVEHYLRVLRNVYSLYQSKIGIQSSQEQTSLSRSSIRPSSPISTSDTPSSPLLDVPNPRRKLKRKSTDDLHSLLGEGGRKQKIIDRGSEIERYLSNSESFGIDFEDSSTNHSLRFWKRASSSKGYPVLAAMARDYLAIPAAGVGVERLFNTARDICSYRRHSLQPETIRLLMMSTCATRFDRNEALRLDDSDSEQSDTLEDECDYGDEDDSDSDIENDIEQVVDLISEDEEASDIEEDDQEEEDIQLPNMPRDPIITRARRAPINEATPTRIGLTGVSRRDFIFNRLGGAEPITPRLSRTRKR